ncbi:MAG: class I adenylate-forming enzyme family protein, partial [Atopobiaceae bacterium]|nr:class I adenylate-forming enzyme family protein [Atopobiaceae bacterium]
MAFGSTFTFEHWDEYERESRVALVCGDRSCTYGELRHAIESFAEELYGLGVREGDHVAIWAFSSINWIVAFYATIRIGGIATLVNFNLLPDNVVPLLELTHANFLIYGDVVARRDDPRAVDGLLEAAHIDPARSFDIALQNVDLVARYEGVPLQGNHAVDFDGTETACIVFSSGTTDLPKAVELSRNALVQNAYATYYPYVRNNPIDRNRTFLLPPLFHVFGLVGQTVHLGIGATVVIPQGGSTQELISLMKRFDFDDMLGVTTTYLTLASDESFSPDIAPSLLRCAVAGGFSTKEQLVELESHFKQAKFYNTYGLTEYACIAQPSPEDSVDLRFSSLGKAAPGVELRIISRDGEVLPANVPGEVVARGTGLTNGYMGLGPEEQPYDAEGWLHTGDMGYLNEEGYLFLVGRIKEIIIRGGENIAPSEVSAALQKLPNVARAVV